MKICRKNPGLDPDSATVWIRTYSAKYMIPDPSVNPKGSETLVTKVLKPANEYIRGARLRGRALFSKTPISQQLQK
jgi:hypothetical protein